MKSPVIFWEMILSAFSIARPRATLILSHSRWICEKKLLKLENKKENLLNWGLYWHFLYFQHICQFPDALFNYNCTNLRNNSFSTATIHIVCFSVTSLLQPLHVSTHVEFFSPGWVHFTSSDCFFGRTIPSTNGDLWVGNNHTYIS